ncbi:threonine/homoserine/homoserine lactone efflux protein [Litoreibacter ponti]|uniref:Threonine/homoserine/homoserine lactone efflux protein n=1 Tax=Litoreibacter ponti TaxID=1510457 RepID=A0A2T6BNH7_9RHOB|nr:LysE family translocator [Litoreibacter ponti]PTX57596.1 threonine/homoserine/homoserine lactone efflux protein [Litoreibacter ponti]
MTITGFQLLLYSGALLVLFLTPGPVWVGLLARAMSGGFHAAWPLALGVVVGDVLWPLIAILGVAWIVDQVSWFMDALRWVAVVMFVAMGVLLIKNADKQLSENARLMRPGMLAGFVAGLAVILANPKAVLFYMGMLPGFFDLTRVTALDILAICVMSFIVPLVGNLCLALSVDRVRGLLKSPKSLERLNLISGGLLILVGVVIGLG